MSRTKTKPPQPALFVEEPPAAKLPAQPKTTKPKGTAVAKAEPGRPNLLAAIVAAASDPGCQPEKMHALLDVRNRLMREMAEVGYRRAYRAAKLAMPTIDKDGKIDEGTTRSGRQGKKALYATYENINKVIGPTLDKNGLDLSLHAEPKPEGDGVLMRATLSYIAVTEYGEMVYAESSVVPMPPDPTGSKNPAQAMSSALAYAKRNAVILVLNLISHAPEDHDRDGRGAPKNKTQEAVEEKKPAAAQVVVITEKQAMDLREKIEDCGVPMKTFCAHYGIDKIADLPAADYDQAVIDCDDYKTKHPRG
jgi:hypothetical protein